MKSEKKLDQLYKMMSYVLDGQTANSSMKYSIRDKINSFFPIESIHEFDDIENALCSDSNLERQMVTFFIKL
jgi:hypothetical protein